MLNQYYKFSILIIYILTGFNQINFEYISTVGNAIERDNLPIMKDDKDKIKIRDVIVKHFGGEFDDKVFSMDFDDSGDIFITGYSSSREMVFDNIKVKKRYLGGRDAYIGRLDQDGQPKWIRYIKGENDDTGSNIMIKDGYIYLAGDYKSSRLEIDSSIIENKGGYDIFLAKFDNNGRVMWFKGYGGPGDDFISSMYINNRGDIYVSGSFVYVISIENRILISPGYKDYFISRIDSNGELIWCSNRNGTDWDSINDIYSNSLIGLYLAGEICSSERGVLYGCIVDYKKRDIHWDVIPYDFDFFISRYCENGEHIWTKRIGKDGNDKVVALTSDNEGNIYITACIMEPNNEKTLLMKMDKDGDIIWEKYLSNIQDNSSNCSSNIYLDSYSNIYLTGYFTGGIRIDEKEYYIEGSDRGALYAVIFDRNGYYLWSDIFKVKGEIIAFRKNKGRLYLAGNFIDKFDLRGKIIKASGEKKYYDSFLIIYSTEE